MSTICKVRLSGHLHIVDCADPATLCRTYGDLRRLLESQSLIDKDHVIYDVSEKEFDLNASINHAQETVVLVRWISFDVEICDESITQMIQVGANRTIAQAREAFRVETDKSVPRLTLRGQYFQDHYTMAECNIRQSDRLVGRVKLTITDKQCELSTTVIVFDDTRIDALKESYAQTAHRHVAPNAQLLDRETVLADHKNIFECQLLSDAQLFFENPPFEITVVDNDEEGHPPVTLSVADHYTPHMIKELYASETRQAIVAEDRLVFESVLNEGECIYAAQVTVNSKLTLHREDQSRSTEYECGSCGLAVKLKRTEPVRCRSCGFRIVYKLRTARACQYIAR